MVFVSHSSTMVVMLSIVFGVSGLLHLTGPGFLLRAYERWEFPRHFHRVAGCAALLTALFLATPQTRLWGVVLGYTVTFVAVVILLSRSQYAWSAAGIVLMVALVPAVLAAA
jgi:DoxX-like protein